MDKCYGCYWLKMDFGNKKYGHCTCIHAKVHMRKRRVTDKACSWKNRGNADVVL